MRGVVDELLTRRGGVATRRELFSVLTRNQLDDEVARRLLVAPFARAYCRPWDADHSAVLERAALASVGQPASLSHLTALRRLALPAADDDRIHVTVPAHRHPTGRSPGLVVHRTRLPIRAGTVAGLPTAAPAQALVQSWPMLTGPEQRAPVIEAVRRNLLTPASLRRAAERAVALPGRARLLRLADQLIAGCESELELWGYLGVFDVPGLRHGTRQLNVDAGGRRYRIDLGYEPERVAVELDGYRWHSTREQRERDMRRDAALATIGWLTLRFSHQRLHGDVLGCRQDVAQVLAARRSWRHSG